MNCPKIIFHISNRLPRIVVYKSKHATIKASNNSNKQNQPAQHEANRKQSKPDF
jgi:hypothetical protein